ncbi:MAG: efflux RND transporter periplasmic adaptor subunit [Vulcanimicrobiaceae bacterium]
MMTPSARALFVTIALASAVGASGCAKSTGGPKGPPPLAVEVAKATRGNISTSAQLDGQVSPFLQSVLSTPQSGTVAAVYVTEGQHVHKGELLAKLDDSSLRAQLASNEALAREAQAKLQSAQLSKPIQSQTYDSGFAAAQQGLVQAKNRVSTDEAALANAKLVYESNQKLYAQGYVAQTTFEQSRSSYVAAQQELANAHSALAAAQASLKTAHANLNQTGVDQANIEASRASLAEAQANVKLLDTQIAQSSLYAPFDGAVTVRSLDPGAFAGPSQPILTISQLATVYVNVNVPDEDLQFVHPGTVVSFTSASLPGRTFRGPISDVNATPTQGTLSYRARIREPNADGVLRGGMLVTVNVLKELHKDVVIVPRTAIAQSDQGNSVYTVKDGKAIAVPVKLGLQTDTLAEVSSPDVTAGTPVITTRPDALQNGSVVAIGGPGAPGGAPPSAAPAAAQKK